jgi:hypothetical protein
MANWRVASIFVPTTTRPRGLCDRGVSPMAILPSLVTKLLKNGRAELFKTQRDMPDEAVTLDFVTDKLVIWGSPGKVVDELLAFREEVGDFGTLLYAGKDWLDRDLGRRSMVLLAEKVLPALNAAIGKGKRAAE